MEQVFLLPYQPDQLKAFLKEAVTDAVLNAIPAAMKTPSQVEFITRKEVCELLGVSLPTVREYTLSGKITGYRIGNRIRYKREEIEQSLNQIKTR